MRLTLAFAALFMSATMASAASVDFKMTGTVVGSSGSFGVLPLNDGAVVTFEGTFDNEDDRSLQPDRAIFPFLELSFGLGPTAFAPLQVVSGASDPIVFLINGVNSISMLFGNINPTIAGGFFNSLPASFDFFKPDNLAPAAPDQPFSGLAAGLTIAGLPYGFEFEPTIVSFVSEATDPMDTAPVPLPPAALLLGGALATFGLGKARRKAKTQGVR